VYESFDTSDPMVQMTMVFAHLERARSSQRALSWHAHRARRGDAYLGRPSFGYVRAPNEHGRPVGPLEIDETTAPLVRRAAVLLLATGSMGDVQRFLGERMSRDAPDSGPAVSQRSAEDLFEWRLGLLGDDVLGRRLGGRLDGAGAAGGTSATGMRGVQVDAVNPRLDPAIAAA
jgi:hypothetical protein